MSALSVGAAFALLPALSGCSPDATLSVRQPYLAGRQQEMVLTSTSARYGQTDDGDAWHVLLRFPLPGASSGGTNYVLYMHTPDPSNHEAAAYALGRTAPARGFFFQTRGEGRGREPMVAGFVWLKRKSGRQWQLRIEADCGLGTELRGTAIITRDDLNVRDYVETHHAGDVADVLKPPAVGPAAGAGQATPRS